MKRIVSLRFSYDLIFVAAFIFIATSPVWGSWLGWPDMANSENRVPANLPPLTSWQEGLAFPHGIEIYLNRDYWE
jgi:hypothetical protein